MTTKVSGQHCDPPAKECIGRFDECKTWDETGCDCVAYCIMAANNARQRPAPQPAPADEPTYLVTERELNLIKNDCAYPESPSCDGCPLADGEDESRASGLGCNFKGANALIDEVLARKLLHPQQQPPDALAELAVEVDTAIEWQKSAFHHCHEEKTINPLKELASSLRALKNKIAALRQEKENENKSN